MEQSLVALRAALAEHLRRRQSTLVQAWATQLRQTLHLPKSTGLPDPATSALSYKELDRLFQQLTSAIQAGDHDNLAKAAAANHHEPLKHSDSIARLLTKLTTLGDVLRRSVADDATLDQLAATHLLDRTLAKLTAESVLVYTEHRRVGVDRIAEHSRSLKETLQAILDSSPVGILVTDREGYITYFNHEQELISGVPRDQALGQKIYEGYARRSDEDVRAAFEKALEHGVTTALPRHSYAGRQGEQSLDILLGPIRDEAGAITGTVHVCRDVTDLTQLEGQVMQRNRELAGKVHELEEAYTYIGKVNRQFASLIDVNSTLSGKMSLDKVLDFIVRSAAMLTRARLVTLRRLDGQQLVLAAQYGMRPDQLNRYSTVDIDSSVIGRVVREHRQILVVDLGRDVNFRWPELIEQFGLKRLVSVPLYSRGRTIGTLSIHLPEQRQFSNLELNFMIALANQAALAIDLERTLRAVRSTHARTAEVAHGIPLANPVVPPRSVPLALPQ